MKKSFTLFIVLLLILTVAKATIVNVSVVNFQFNPSNINVVVGDVVRFNFQEGYHNVASTSVPGGAAQISSGGASDAIRSYNYTVSVAGTYEYECQVHPAQMSGTITATGVVPVNLKLFEVSALPDKKPMLNWRTLTEQNVSYFSVRSSVDGKNFTEVARVPAKGNSNTEQVYSYKDDNVSPKHRYVYYELVTTDKDGKESYSAIKMFKTAFATAKLVMQLGPNPIKRPGQLMIQFNAENAGSMLINVFDNNGKQVLKTKMAAFPGLNNGHVHVCDLPPGVYTLQFSYEGLRETKKVVVN
jgi:plastocyanin